MMMTHGSDSDGNADFSGSGFMPSQNTQNSSSSPSAYSKKQNRDTQSLIPLTVKQISNALSSEDNLGYLVVDGADVSNIKLVGKVLKKKESVTDVSFLLDDGTGGVDCIRWVYYPVDEKEMSSIMNGMYVLVHGQLKSFQEKKQIVVYGIKRVTDFDEITLHFVECIYVHSYHTKLMKQKAISSNQTHMPERQLLTQTPIKTAPSNQGLDEDVKMVFGYMMMPSSLKREKGVHQDELVSQLGIPLDRIKAAIQILLHEACVYEVDDVHVKGLANG